MTDNETLLTQMSHEQNDESHSSLGEEMDSHGLHNPHADPGVWITPKKNKEAALIDFIQNLFTPLGYELVDLHIFQQKHKKIQIFIDDLVASPSLPKKTIGIEDCVKATHCLNEILDTCPLIEELFHENEYELEVSSPGIERPLTQAKDFIYYQGKQARVSTIRALSEDELQNAEYALKNPKQKNFLGILLGTHQEKVRMSVLSTEAIQFQKKLKKGQKISQKKLNEQMIDSQEIEIPFALITKAHLEPLMSEALESHGSEKGKK